MTPVRYIGDFEEGGEGRAAERGEIRVLGFKRRAARHVAAGASGGRREGWMDRGQREGGGRSGSEGDGKIVGEDRTRSKNARLKLESS